MERLQELVESYLVTSGFTILDSRPGLVVADQRTLGGDSDTRVLWITPPATKVESFSLLERGLSSEFRERIDQYPDAHFTVIGYSREGFSAEFIRELRPLRIQFLVPIQFFDTPLKQEGYGEPPEIKKLRESESTAERVPQPYSVLVAGDIAGKGDDLLPHLERELTQPTTACLHIVTGAAGAGKTVLFRALFPRLYDTFLSRKKRQELIAFRPMPITPDFVGERVATNVRMHDVMDYFVDNHLTTRLPPDTFRWMLRHGYATWLFDGLDELYAGDRDFLDEVLELLTAPGSVANIVLCVRDAMLTNSTPFAEFISEYSAGDPELVRIYRLNEWQRPSKRAFGWKHFERRMPPTGTDTPQVARFLEAVEGTPAARQISGIPFYCRLLADAFQEGSLDEEVEEGALIERAIAAVIRREEQKGLLRPQQFYPNEFRSWLETVALEYYESEFMGVPVGNVQEYADLVLRPELSPDERYQARVGLLHFPIFRSGLRPGLLAFEHELVAEYLAACAFAAMLPTNAPGVALRLGKRVDLGRSLVARLLARQGVADPGTERLTETLVGRSLPGRSFGNLLQILLLASPGRDFLKDSRLSLEARDLSYVEFGDRDLSGVSFRNSDLTGTTFRRCSLEGAAFEGAYLIGTRFLELEPNALNGSHFADLQHFDHVFFGSQRVDEPRKLLSILEKATGRIHVVGEPCPTGLQVRELFKKFVNLDGTPRRDQVSTAALIRGTRHNNAPNPESCVESARRFGYLEGPDYRDRYRRTAGEMYSEMRDFVMASRMSTGIRNLLNSLCTRPGCDHSLGAREAIPSGAS